MQERAADVVIVGAGIVGLCTALYLRRLHDRLVILDPNAPGTGCSSGNAGSVSPGSVAPLGMPGVLRQLPSMLLDPGGPLRIPARSLIPTAPWLLRFLAASGKERVADISDSLHAILRGSLERHAEILDEIGASDLIRTTGQLHLYPDEESLAKDAGGWRLRREHGVRLDPVGPAEIRELEPAVGDHYRVGYFLPEQGMIANPLRLSEVLAAYLQSQGVRFVSDEAVGLAASGNRVTGAIGRSGATYPAGQVVVSAGAWSSRLLRPLGENVPLETQRGYHVMVRPGAVTIQRPVVAADRKLFCTPMETGLRLAGTVEFGGLERSPNYRRARHLFRHGQRLFPALETEQPASLWMGHRPCMPDSLPVVGPSDRYEGLWYNFGHGHLGLTMAPNSGRLLAEAMRGSSQSMSILARFSLSRFG